MKVLVLGGGGREHALAWALRRSAAVSEVFAAPGNAGVEAAASCVSLALNKPAEILRFMKGKEIDLAVIGPEAPLVDGLADALRAGGRLVFGPGAAAAKLEGSKIRAKEFMRTHGLPTADFRVFVNAQDALAYVRSAEWKDTFRVVKADGLAAGKGVVVAKDRAEVLAAVEAMMLQRAHGTAGERILIEEILTGEELSVMALTDGKTLVPLLPTQDHKRVFDNDQGPNTGGMGAYGPVPQVGADLWRSIEKEVFDRFLAGLAAEALDYRGVIYFGLMLTPAGPRVLEFNVRFGDPETQVILPMGKGDWLPLFLATAEGNLGGKKFKAHDGAAVTVVLASGGYPGAFEKGKAISGLEDVEDSDEVSVFHAGTARDDRGRVVTAGGRVLTVTARGADLVAARQTAYAAAGKIKFDGAHFRTDIGARALAALAKR
jgi:phosphoribosylamine--glycine ligase